VQSSPASPHIVPLRSKNSSQHPVHNHRQSLFFSLCERSITGKITVSSISIFKFLDKRKKTKRP
jgi:hypothetical protein